MQTPTLSQLRVRLLNGSARPPVRQHEGDAGLDIASCEDAVIGPGERRLITTGVAVEIPSGWVGLMCPRSGLALRHGITMVNAPGVIDAGYRGELRVILLNTDASEEFHISVGDRIAQLLLTPVSLSDVVVVDELSDTIRSADGFGSTGVRD